MSNNYAPAPSSEGFAPEAVNASSERKRKKQYWMKVGASVLGVLVVVAIIVILVVTLTIGRTPKPGLVVHHAGKGDQHLIAIKKDAPSQALSEFIKEYETVKHSVQIKECQSGDMPASDEACLFSPLWLGETCSKEENWGYTTGKPCILLTVTKVLDWVPEVYQSLEELPENMPEDLKDRLKEIVLTSNSLPKMLWVSCDGINPADVENLGRIRYSPWLGFPLYYFPYRDYHGYMSPIIGLTLLNPKRGVLIGIECRIWAKNIDPKTSATRINLTME